jgi:hypothetical protein
MAVHAYLGWSYRSTFAPMLRAREAPDAAGEPASRAHAAAAA